MERTLRQLRTVATEFATREDAIKHYQQDLTKEEFKELEMFADFLRYRRGHQP